MRITATAVAPKVPHRCGYLECSQTGIQGNGWNLRTSNIGAIADRMHRRQGAP